MNIQFHGTLAAMSRTARVHVAGSAQSTANLALFDVGDVPDVPPATPKPVRRYASVHASSAAVLQVREAPPAWLADKSPADEGRQRRERRWPTARAPRLAATPTTPVQAELPPPTEVIEEQCLSLLRANDAPDLPYRLAINPYRGCEHACVGCELAVMHGIGGSAGMDASAQQSTGIRIYAKVNAAERLREELRRPGYVPRPLNLGSATDAYQPAERRLRLTRTLIEVLHESGHPFALATRSAGVVRDLDLLAEMAVQRKVLVLMSMTSLDTEQSRTLEPHASSPALRLSAMRALAQAGVWVGLNLSPLRLDMDPAELEVLLAAVADAGARSVHWRIGSGALGRGDADVLALQALIERTALANGLRTQLPELNSRDFNPPRSIQSTSANLPGQHELF
jgi:DNA repair photolyase